ncbi:MAG: hypothetical protein ACLP9L_05425 [Thermoguttaceae bacterium]
MTLTRKASIDRTLAALVLSAVLVSMDAVFYTVRAAARLEFESSAIGRKLRAPDAHFSFFGLQREGYRGPELAAYFRELSRGAWVIPVAAVPWALWIVRKRKCSLLAVVCFVCVSVDVTVIWVLFALLSLYLNNQRFIT